MKFVTSTLILILLTVFANAQEWVRQNPHPKLSQMTDIDFDGKYGLAVGVDSTLFTTTNKGATWVPRKPTINALTFQSALVVPGTFGETMFAAGGDILVVTRDGGDTWFNSHNEIPAVFKIQWLGPDTLIVLGDGGGLFSIDNGALWQTFPMPGFGTQAGHFTTIKNGWVAFGDFGEQQVWVTTDGGTTWVLRDPATYGHITSIHMIDDLLGFMSTTDFVYKTINGGQSWTPLQTISANHIHDVHVIDDSQLWAALDNGSVYFTTAGGAVWEEINPNLINSNRTLGVWANAQGEVWLAGKYVSILHSTDYGQTWTDQIPNVKQTLFEPHFSNALNGMVGGVDGTILRTKNSGASWEHIEFPQTENFYGTHMVNDTTVIVGSSSGTIFMTTDRGDNWTPIGNNLGSITDLYAFSTKEIFATNELGQIWRTTDGGIIWVEEHDGPGSLTSIDFYNDALGWANGDAGKILVTTNGGDTWTVQLQDERNQFSDVTFVTNTEGWVVSSSFTDTIWHTTNAGASWDKVSLPYKTFWRGVSFMDRDTGWITGGAVDTGVVYRTNNAGLSWFRDHTSPAPLMGIYAIPNSETVWAVGFGGNIMKFSSCITPPTLSDLRGSFEPCNGDTINFVVESTEVDIFDWTFPSDWNVLGNTNTNSIFFIAGSTPGQVSVQGSNACGDTTELVLVDVFPVTPPAVTIMEDENGLLTSSITSGFHQWLLNGEIIPGAIQPTYTPTEDGIYQLLLTTPGTGCETLSNELTVIITGIDDPADQALILYPNPANEKLYFKKSDGKSLNNASVSIIHMNGSLMLKENLINDAIDIHNIPSGIYMVRVQTGNEQLIRKIIVE